MTRARFLSVSLVLGLFLHVGCASRVQVPPAVDLGRYRTIGLIEFSSNDENGLRYRATQRFLESVQAAQPGVRVLELGNEAELLRRLDQERLDIHSVREIGQHFDVDAIFVGHLELGDVKPALRMSDLTSMEIEADVEGSLGARLMETGTGATVWTRSVRKTRPVLHAGIEANRPGLHASDPSLVYEALTLGLAADVSADFRPRWVRQ